MGGREAQAGRQAFHAEPPGPTVHTFARFFLLMEEPHTTTGDYLSASTLSFQHPNARGSSQPPMFNPSRAARARVGVSKLPCSLMSIVMGDPPCLALPCPALAPIRFGSALLLLPGMGISGYVSDGIWCALDLLPSTPPVPISLLTFFLLSESIT
jgi:hypothetical protein